MPRLPDAEHTVDLSDKANVSRGTIYFHYMDKYDLLEFQEEVDKTKGKNEGFNQDLVVQFVASSYVGVVEWWFTNQRPVTYLVLAEQLGGLLDRICE